MSIGARWKQAREAAGFSAARAAVAADVHENTIYLLENDRKNDGVTLRLCKQVAATYGVTLADIFCADDDRPVTVPSELQPLHDMLRPLTVDDRVAFVRNVVSNASFMARLISGPRDESHASEQRVSAYNVGSASAGADEPGALEEIYRGSVAGEPGARAKIATVARPPRREGNPKN